MTRKRFNRLLSVVMAAVLLIPAYWPAAAAQADSSVTEVLSQSFEDGNTGGWHDLGWNGTGTVVVSDVYGSEGTHSLQYKDRSGRNSSLGLTLTSLLKSGHSYDISFKMRSDQGTDTYHMTSKVVSDGEDTYDWTIGNHDVTDTGWTTFEKKNFIVPGNTTEILFYIEAYGSDTAAHAAYYLDEVLIKDVTPGSGGGTTEPTRPPAQIFQTVNFEDGEAGGFTGRAGTEVLSVTSEANHTEGGSKSLKVEGRTDTWHGPTLRVETYVDKGSEYRISAWVKLISPDSAPLQLATQIGQGSGAGYNSVASRTVNASDGWVKLEGTFRYSNVGEEYLTLYVESSSSSTASFYIDDISFVKTDSVELEVQKDLLPIKEAYQNDFLIGNAIVGDDLVGKRLELLKMHHNVVTAGNAMKPDALQNVKGVFTFDSADAMVNKVIAEGMKMHGHVLVWHQQSPTWMNTATDGSGATVPLSRDEALDNLRTHIRTVMSHFGNRVISWDVVNEAMNDNPSNPTDWENALRKSPWYNAIGSDYVEQAFLAAREVLDENPDWNIKLYYNDYNDDNQNKSTAIASMVQELNDKYAATHPGKKLIDGIGMQGHYGINTNPANVKLSLEKFIATGAEVSVTELDIQAGSGYALTDKEAEAQAYLYAQLMQLYAEHKSDIARVTFWGMDDATSWRAEKNPLLFDKNLQAKPAYYGVIDPAKFISEHTPDTTGANVSTAAYGTPAIDGTVDSIWNQAPVMNVNRYQMAWQGATGTAKTLWDDKNLYVLVQVSDGELDKSSPNPWEQDSVEVFLDQNNGKTTFYQDDDGQYRINYDNETSFSPSAIGEGVETKTVVSGTNYTVEMKIPFTAVTPANDTRIGFDIQINDGKAGARESVAAWNDTTGNGYQDTSVYGIVTLAGKPSDGSGGGTENPRNPAVPFDTLTFEDGKTGAVTGRAGTEQLSVTDEVNHTTGGSKSLKVEGRSETWNGPMVRIETNVDQGQEYRLTAWVKLIDPASTTLRLSTQVGQGSGASYNSVASKTVNAEDGWVKLEGTYSYNSLGDEFLTMYVEAPDSKTASFYIDDLSFINTGSLVPEVQTELKPVKEVYQDDFLIGSAVSAADLEGKRLELLKLHHNVVTAENAMKPDGLQKEKGVFTYAAADQIVNVALSQDMQVHGHVLVWHQQTPAWMNTATNSSGAEVPLSREEALSNMRTHIHTVMNHFGNKVISWDVVNEAMNDNPSNPADWQNALRQSAWYKAIGPDFVEQAFLAAREVLDEHPDWDIKLYYNDYNEDNQNKSTAIASMVQELNDKYAATHPGQKLIDGIGMQGHYSVNTNQTNVKLSLERFIATGAEVSVTELDVGAGSNGTMTDKEALAQGYFYAQLMELYKEHSANIARVTFWGLNDANSWRSENSPLLFDKNLQAKPAYYAVIDPAKFISEHTPDTAGANVSTAVYGTPVIDGTADSIWDQAPVLNVNRYQMAWQGAHGTARTLWDDNYLYVLVQVIDDELDKSSVNPWEQDSIEVFLDQNNGKTTFYQEDDGQYRVNYDNETSFSPASIGEGVETKTHVSGTNYTVEMKIPLKAITPANDKKIGFDVQINDGKAGSRESVAAWNDITGNGYQDTSVYGVLTLKDKKDDPEPPTPTPTPTPTPAPGGTNNVSSSTSTPKPADLDSKDGVVTVRPEVKTEGGEAKATVTGDLLKKALEQAVPAADGKKQIVIYMPKQTGAASYEVQLPLQGLKGQPSFVLVIQTDHATLTIPSQLLAGIQANTEYVSIRVKEIQASSLNAAARSQTGNRPVVELSLLAGGQKIAWSSPDAAMMVSIPYKPAVEELGYSDSLLVRYLSSNGNMSAVVNSRYEAVKEALVFHTTEFGTFAAAYAPMAFTYMGNLTWAQQATAAMSARGVIPGTSGDGFSPAASISRADFTAFLVRALELQGTGQTGAGFSDVQSSAQYSAELATAKQLGIVAGYTDNTFRPDSLITRQEMMVIAARALKAAGIEPHGSGSIEAYTDADQISAYARDSLAALLKYGVVSGKDGRLAPDDKLTRAEAAVILYRIWKL